ncbi:MAG: XRE family transcriptional regulator [Candidatus Dadabacteria bacterium]|nr:MAG: XRE family transcriptional regulator [Candidatus Dadabacteria bacterium]
MWLDHNTIKTLAKSRGLSLRRLLDKANISRTAYYSLVRSATLVPLSVHKLAAALGVPADRIVSTRPLEEAKYRSRLVRLENILRKYPGADRENVWHTLVLLDMPPIERLRGALRRATR